MCCDDDYDGDDKVIREIHIMHTDECTYISHKLLRQFTLARSYVKRLVDDQTRVGVPTLPLKGLTCEK